jgi:DNA polymerase III sliding clamp (beta) subunit (PCNA family)
MRSIGELARDSGLTPSALRFYDGTGLLVPSWVDPASGYRWYAPEQLADARLLARLRRVQMPLADLRLVLAGWSNQDTSLVRSLLAAHLLRLENGLADARRELSTVSALLALREIPVSSTMTTTAATVTRLILSAPELAAALDQVRFAVSADPELPMLRGVLFDAETGPDPEAETGSLRAVATDRYRMSLSTVPSAVVHGPSVQAIVPVALVDAMRALLGDRADADAELTFDGGRVALAVDGSQAAGQRLDFDFPDYRRLTRLPAGRRIPVDVPALRQELLTGASRSRRRGQDDGAFELSVLSVAEDGSVSVVADVEARAESAGTFVAVNREFLLEALAVSGSDQLVLELGGPIAPLAIRLPADDSAEQTAFSLLMPVRLTE